MSEKAKGHDGLSWPWTMDAQVWAAEFKRLFPESDESLMLSWFANAIMRGYDTARQRDAQQLADVAYLEAWRAADLRRYVYSVAGGDAVRWIAVDPLTPADVIAESVSALGARLRALSEEAS